jgi:hypothetical protein
MIDLPEIKQKRPWPICHKPEAVRDLESMANDARRKHPSIHPHHLAPRLFRDDTANVLTACIVIYTRRTGVFASRLNNTGVCRNGRYTRSISRRGLPDVLVTGENGLSIFVEVKIKKDRKSHHQQVVRDDQTKAEDLYFVAHDFASLRQWFDRV